MCLTDKIRNYIDAVFTSPDNNVYHYSKNINGILESKFFLLNPHNYLNKKDPTNAETQTAVELISQCMRGSETLNKYLIPFEEFLNNGIVFYSTSFCKQPSELMSLKYGPGCLKVETAFLNDFTSNNKFTLFGDVKYSEIENKGIIQDLFEIFTENVRDPSEDYRLFLSWLCIVIPLLKPQVNADENESRIIQVEVYKIKKLLTPKSIGKIEFSEDDVVAF